VHALTLRGELKCFLFVVLLLLPLVGYFSKAKVIRKKRKTNKRGYLRSKENNYGKKDVSSKCSTGAFGGFGHHWGIDGIGEGL
jgi:hypothetical protein